ncbi:MAG: HWE histidine kinase domain-containing protein [Sphingomonas sp.]
MSDAGFQLALEATGYLGSWEWDVARDRVHADTRLAAFHALPARRGAAGLPIAGVLARIQPDDRARVAARLDEARAACGTLETAYRIRRPDGGIAWISLRGRCQGDAEGRVIRVSGIALDITARKAMEDALRDSETRTRLALEAADIGVWESSVDLVRQQWDARTRILLGYEAAGEPSYGGFLDQVHPDDRDGIATEIADVLAGEGRTLDSQYRVVARGGQHWVNVRGRLVGGEAGPRFVGTIRDITPQKVAEERGALLANELNHRIKNTLAVVQSIVNQSLRRAVTPEEASEAIGDRLAALARAHDLLTRTSWSAAPLRTMVESAVSVLGDHSSRVILEGPDVWLRAKAALAFAMAMHELVTNAAKHGALTNEAGRVTVRWRRSGEAEAALLAFEWIESGGPPVAPPAQAGFGSKLMKGLARDLGGEGCADYPPEGLRWTLIARLAAIEEPSSSSG